MYVTQLHDVVRNNTAATNIRFRDRKSDIAEVKESVIQAGLRFGELLNARVNYVFG